VSGETARELRVRLLVVPVAVALVLLTAVRPAAGHADLVEEGRTDAPSTHVLKELLYSAGRDPGVFAGPLADRVAKRHHGAASTGHEGTRGITAVFPGVTTNHLRQPLGEAIRRHVFQLI